MGVEQIRQQSSFSEGNLSTELSGEARTRLARELTACLVDPQVSELVESWPELEPTLAGFKVAFEESVAFLIEADATFAHEAVDWQEARGITGKLEALNVNLEELRERRRMEDKEMFELRRRIRQKQRRVLREEESKTFDEALVRFGHVFGKHVLRRPARTPSFPWEKRKLESKNERLSQFRNQIQELMERRGRLQGLQQERHWERASFEEDLVETSAEWAAENSDYSFAYGLVFPEHIGSFLTTYSKRVRGAPQAAEVAGYLTWLMESAKRANALPDLAYWLDNTGLLPGVEKIAWDLVAAYEAGSDEFKRLFEAISGVARANWGIRDARATPFRKNCVRFLRRELIGQWMDYGVYERESSRPPELPFLERAQKATEVGDKVIPGEGGAYRVVLELPDGRKIEADEFSSEDLGMVELPRGERGRYAEKLRFVIGRLREDPFAAWDYELEHPIAYGKEPDEVATHRFWAGGPLRIVGRIENKAEGGAIRVVVFGGGPKWRVEKAKKLAW